jgi:uncharacterized protein YndB with AHSA1/START domain
MGDRATTKAAGIGDDAVRAKTGKTWAEWFAVLDRAGAAAWPHKQIAVYLGEQCGCPDWWSQMITVGYEQARGRRVKHQTANGFVANASKTIAAPVAALYAAWANSEARAKWLPGAAKITVRKATANKSLRITGADGTTSIEVNFWVKGPAKSQVAVQQSKLASVEDVAKQKGFWAAALAKLQLLLAGAAGDGTTTAVSRRAQPAVAPKKKPRKSS